MDIHREFYHIVGWDALALVLGVGETCEWQGVDGIELGGRHDGVWPVDDDIPVARQLQEALCVYAV